MGDPRKQRRNYQTPRHPWRRDQVDQELQLLGEYGLRNKRELWRSQTMLSKMRGIARSLLARSGPGRLTQEKLFLGRMVKMGLLAENAGLDDVLDLNVHDLLSRRLQTQVYQQGLATSIQQARQFVTHGHISVTDRRVSVPGYLVPKREEALIRLHPDSPVNKTDHPARTQVSKKPKLAPQARPVSRLAPEIPKLLEQEVPAEIEEEEAPVPVEEAPSESKAA